MFKVLGLVIVGLMLGCSSSSKKAAEPAKAPVETKAATPAPAPETQTDAKAKSAKGKKTDSAAAKKPEASAKGDVTCVNGSDSRTLSIKAKNEGCELEYKGTAVASQINGDEKCTEVSTRIQGKLEAAGFKCN